MLIADDQAHVREGLKEAVELSGLEVVAEAGDGQEAVRLTEMRQPSVVLMDVRLPVMDGLEATRRIKVRWPQVKVIVLTIHEGYRTDARLAGADVFMPKKFTIQELLEAIADPNEATETGRRGNLG